MMEGVWWRMGGLVLVLLLCLLAAPGCAGGTLQGEGHVSVLETRF
jgi:hypothetical protein